MMQKYNYYSLSKELKVSVATIKKAIKALYNEVPKKIEQSSVPKVKKYIADNPEKIGIEILKKELYKEVYQKMINEGYILRASLTKLFGINTNNIQSVLDNFDSLGLLIYEDEIETEKSKKSHNNKKDNIKTQLVILPFNPIRKEWDKEINSFSIPNSSKFGSSTRNFL